jgi:hypothetical protein
MSYKFLRSNLGMDPDAPATGVPLTEEILIIELCLCHQSVINQRMTIEYDFISPV